MLYTLIGKKIGMTQLYNDKNVLIPITVVEAGPCPVVQVKTDTVDGYSSIQIGYGSKKEKSVTQPMAGHYKKFQVTPCAQLKEVVCSEAPTFKSGDLLTVEGFKEGQYVDVIGTTKGKGFQGVVKRHGFSGGPASHGSMFHRRGGSYGQCQWPGEIDKGRPMPGRTGGERRTMQNLKIVKVIPEKNLILIQGSIPGAKGCLVTVRSAKKKKAA